MTHESTAVQLASSSSNATARGGWWRDAVIYQVYVRSFADSDGDGVGDLRGVRSRLPHLARLGVDAVWLTPFYVSPQADGGYDVVDYRAVDPLFGDLSDADELVRAAHEQGLRVIVDVVPNHTSAQHPWFRAALAGDPAARARYLFRPGRGADGSEPPNDWESIFGGPAWTRVAAPAGDGGTSQPEAGGEWYLHLFAPEQPDLDWDHPEVAAEFASVLRFWLDLGVDGFRVDVAHGMVKAAGLPDIGRGAQATLIGTEPLPFFDQDGVHEIHRGWRRLLDSYEGDRIGVAEAWAPTSERLALYVRPDELHQAFNFRFLNCPWDPAAMRTVIDESLAATTSVGAPTTWVLSNHDVVRHVTRYGGGARGLARARAAALLMLALPGSAYLYQGEELGLPEVLDLPDESRRDPAFRRGRRRQIPGAEPELAPGTGPAASPLSGAAPPAEPAAGPGGVPGAPAGTGVQAEPQAGTGPAAATATHAATSRTASVSAPVPQAQSPAGPIVEQRVVSEPAAGTGVHAGQQAGAGTGPIAPVQAATSRTASVSAPAPQAQSPAGPGPTAQAGRTDGPQANVVTGPEAGAGTGPEAGAGTGPEAGAGTGPEAGAGTGPQAGAGTGPQAGAGVGPEAGAGTGPEARAGTGPQAGAGTGPQAGAGTGPQAGAGTGPQAGAGTGPQAGAGTGPQAGAGTGPQAGAGTGPQAGAGTGPEARRGPGPRARVGAGPEAEPQTGPEAHAQAGAGPQAGVGVGPGVDLRSGPEADGQEGLRDGCRVPIPWCGAEPPYGFGPTGSWLPQPAGWGGLTVAAQTGDPHSTLELYRAALELRRAMPGLGAPEAGTGPAAEAPYLSGMRWLPAPEGVLLFTRPGFACTLNSRPDPVELPAPGRPVLSSSPVETDGRTVRLPPDSCTWWAI
ncbi:alpha-amylase family glycosyl hydrolase [Streptomyces sp. NBC_01233]|uniref:alpha-amylase family glycosyl hydrolase n=1 Tax=Streptomyces sp. NBC_01233 TaxID=2903787 RepID=UPI002E12BC7E|nr:alpha-amylase family glycosyl hydrolase [Streptomyces sp. NBC_01233]